MNDRYVRRAAPRAPERNFVDNDYLEASRVFHELTKHSYTSVRSSPHYLDWEIKPMPYKIYPAAGALGLPRDLALPRTPALTAIADDGRGRSGAALGIESLTRILFCADGLTRARKVGGEDYHFRAAASAGALYPVELYVAAARCEGIEPGLYHFSPADLKLRGLRRGDWRGLLARASAGRPSIESARAVVIMTSIFWRSTWKYRARGYRYCFWDTGTVAANLLAAAATEDLSAEVVTAFVDSELERLLGVDGAREGVSAMIALGDDAARGEEPPEPGPLEIESIALSPREVAYPELVKIHSASSLETAEQVRAVASARLDAADQSLAGAGARPGTIAPHEAMGLGETIMARGSTRVFAREAIGAEELATVLGASSRGPRADFPRLTDTYLIVNAVAGIEPGAYCYHRETARFELIKPGDFRAEAGYLCLEQPLGMDCSALLVYMADLERTLGALGNRGYRDVHLEAGILGGRAYLASYALGRGATGLTFYDDDTTKFFAPHSAGKSPILMVAIGIPKRSPMT
jgi:SagB-type dehydrogenase family enzyme